MRVIGFQRLTLRFQHPVDARNGDPVLHRLQVHANRDAARQLGRKRHCIRVRQSFKDLVAQPCHPFGQSKLNRPLRVVVVVQAATDEAALAAFPASTLDNFIGGGMGVHAGDQRGLDRGIVAK